MQSTYLPNAPNAFFGESLTSPASQAGETGHVTPSSFVLVDENGCVEHRLLPPQVFFFSSPRAQVLWKRRTTHALTLWLSNLPKTHYRSRSLDTLLQLLAFRCTGPGAWDYLTRSVS